MSNENDPDCAQQAEASQYIGTGGCLGNLPIDHQQMMRDQRVQSAIWALSEARRVRNDPALMAEVREWVAAKRSEFMLLLDDLDGA